MTTAPAAPAIAPPATVAAATISLSLVSHTNAGKTTLARTLLGRDIGEVRDEAHVTEQAEGHTLIATPAGDRLQLWDTPGFGDSQRLARRMAQAGSPLGWLLGEVWDRWRDRPFWASQRALRHVLAESDVVLYLVNAAEAPADVGYLDAELQILTLVGKPVIALLNQTGPAGAGAVAGGHDLEIGSADEPLLAAWRERLMGPRPGPSGAASVVREVLALDAFTRCWVQEGVLWRAVARALPTDPARNAAFERLRLAWQQRQHALWSRALHELARRMSRAALDREALPPESWRGALQNLGSALGRGLGKLMGPPAGPAEPGNAPSADIERAMASLAERLDTDLRQSTQALIEWHGLDGRAQHEVMSRLAHHYAVRQPLDAGAAALWGGAVTGALTGLKADLASGGLTLGGGLLVGGVLGALSAVGAVRGVNKIRGLAQPQVAWDNAVLATLLANALLGYLAIAHHGRGRGAWVAAEPPPRWLAAVQAVLAERQDAVDELWRQRQVLLKAEPLDPQALQAPLAALLHNASAALLARLYPGADAVVTDDDASVGRASAVNG